MTPKETNRGRLFSLLFGGFLALALLKFGNPAVLEKMISWPASPLEWLINSWPVAIGFAMLGGLVVVGIFSVNWKSAAPRWLLWLPLVWLGWQFISATHTVSGELTRATLLHFTACAVCFYLGYFVLAQTKDIRLFFGCLLAGLAVVIMVGWQQHFGGLEQTRQYFFTYIYPQMKTVSPEYLKKMSSTRIFSTLFYPNALAGALLLLLPPALAVVWQCREWLTTGARALVVGLVGVGALACLFWSGSKGGWLLMLALGLVALLRLKFDRKLKWLVIVTILVAGGTVFTLRFAGYFQKGAPSAVARGDYWQAAARTVAANPVFGTGPGTFAIPYAKIKRPESEMARLVHNDFLQQASDSGFVGGLAYVSFIFGSLWVAYRRLAPKNDWLRFAVWLGLLGWSLQGFVEFGLYIPALGWMAFALFGWLLGANEFDKTPPNG